MNGVLLITRNYRHVATGQIHKIALRKREEAWEGGKEWIVTIQTNLLADDFTHSWLGSRAEFFKEFQLLTK
jgi:hypothetical protein